MKRLGSVIGAGLLAIACGGTGIPSETPAEEPAAFVLRTEWLLAAPPENRFTWSPYALITADGVSVTQAPVPASFPGPLLPTFFGAAITDAGYARIVERSRELGLLEGDGDFTPVGAQPGGPIATITMRIDGATRILTGDPNARFECITTPCTPGPGTPEAFGTFWREIGDLRALVGDALGREAPYHPEGYGLLIGMDPLDPAGLPVPVVPWPLETPLAETGTPIGEGSAIRCAGVYGEDAVTLEAAFGAANQLTQWVDEGADPADAVTITVRALLPGDGDICTELFGTGG